MSTMTEKKRLTVWHYDDDFNKEKLKKMAKIHGHSMSQLIVQLIKTFMDNQEKGEQVRKKR